VFAHYYKSFLFFFSFDNNLQARLSAQSVSATARLARGADGKLTMLLSPLQGKLEAFGMLFWP
jgi:hypothetical protein